MQQQQQDFTKNPAAALTRFLGLVLFTALFWWLAENGWPGAWLVAGLLGLAALAAFFDVLRAHRYWKIVRDLETEAHATTHRHTTRRGDDDRRPPDGWE